MRRGLKGPFAVSSAAWTVKFGRQKTLLDARQKRPGLRLYHSITTRIIKPMMERAVVNAGMISMVAFPRVRSRGREGRGGRMRHAEIEGFTWMRRWTASEYLRLATRAIGFAYAGLRSTGQI